MRNWWFYLGMFVVVNGMEFSVKTLCGLEKVPTVAAVAIGVGSGLVATLAYILAKLEDRDKKDHE
jgi:hypothetical protein